MHESVLVWAHRMSRKYGLKDKKTLELGSYDVNGSVRRFFSGEYTGIDLNEGPGVDQVLSAHDAASVFDGSAVEVVVCTEMLEHDPAFWITADNIKTLLSRGGHLMVTTRGNSFPYHNPPDYWRFNEEGLRQFVELAGCEVLELMADPQVPGWFVLAERK